MSAPSGSVRVLPFVMQVLERDGAAVEEMGPDRLYAVLPMRLRSELDLPGAAALDLSGEPEEGWLPFPLEGVGMQWLIDRARSRGRRVSARLGSPPQNPSGRLEKARALLSLPNATVVHAEAMRPLATRVLLEFGYEAQSEERTDGRVHVAVAESGMASSALADALLDQLVHASPIAPRLEQAAIEHAADQAASVVEAEVRKRLDPFCASSRLRMEAERERIVQYHDRLAREARGRRGRSAPDAAALASKRDAILRQRSERLDDMAERHAVAASWWQASALELRYEITLCRFRLRRRKREVEVDVEWDPFLGDFLGSPCSACGTPTLSFHVCDAKGHVTCAKCAARCEACGHVTCRSCRSEGCGCQTA